MIRSHEGKERNGRATRGPRLLGLGLFSLGYLLLYQLVIVPLMASSIVPQDGGPICVFFFDVLNFLYLPPMAVSELLSSLPVPLFVDGPSQPGTWVIVMLFGTTWGLVLGLIRKAVGGAIKRARKRAH